VSDVQSQQPGNVRMGTTTRERVLPQGTYVEAILLARRCIPAGKTDTVTASVVLPQFYTTISPANFPKAFTVVLILPDPAMRPLPPIESGPAILEKVRVGPGAIALLIPDVEFHDSSYPHCYGKADKLARGVITRDLRY
jgi:hypothetical protein